MRLPFAVGFLFASLHTVGISVWGIDPQLRDYWPVPFTFIIVTALVVGVLEWPKVRHGLAVQKTDWLALQVKIAEYEKQIELARRDPEPQQQTVEVDPNGQRLYRWVAWWTTTLEWVAGNGDNFTYQSSLRHIMTWPAFDTAFAGPLEAKGWLTPRAEREGTKPMPGWTAARMLGAIGRGDYPPAPTGEPPPFKQTDPNNSGKQRQNSETVFATDQ